MAWNLRNLLLFVLLSGAAFLSYVLSREPAMPVRTDETAESAQDGYRLADAVLYRTDHSGRILYRVLADRVQKHAENDDLSLEGLRVQYTPASEIRWEVSAAHGAAPADVSHIQLVDFRLSHAPGGDGDEAVIEGKTLHLSADEHLASTDHPVSFRRGKSTLTAASMKAHLKDDIVELFNAIGRLDP